MLIECIDAGCLPYLKALHWQKELSKKRQKEQIPDHLLLLEHPPVFTMGRRDSLSDLLVSKEWIQKNGMQLIKTDRGGRITYHGPGQLVGYLIFNLKDSIPKLVWKIEEVLLKVLCQFHLQAERDKNYPGIWIQNRKIASLGLHVDRQVTTHGFSLNVSCNLKPFQYIHPCGIKNREVTSLEKELGWGPSMKDVKDQILKAMVKIFKSDLSVSGIPQTHPE